MLKAVNISKSFGRQTLFEGVNFTINPRERVGLTGRNGHGKTTLLKIIIGEDHADEGEISIPREYRLGHVSQHLHFSTNTVIEECSLGLSEHEKDDHWKVEKILFGLGFTGKDMQRRPLEFSGGYQVRLNLAKVLVSEPNMLLLDEPTNYLDILSIRWLSNYLRQWKGEVLLITHDRSFMDSVVTHTMGIHRKKIRKVEGDTEKLYNQIIKEEEIHEKTRLNDEKKRKEVEIFISRFRAKARLAGMVQSRVKALEKQDRLDRLEKIKDLEFQFNYKPFNARILTTIDGLTFSYNRAEEPLIRDFSITIGRHDRICLIGKNGRGKSTLLRLIAGELDPDSGNIQSHQSTAMGYFAQTNTTVLNDSLTVEDEIMGEGCEKQTARAIAGAMLFEGDMALKKIAVLSGGEKSRVLLGKILARQANIILLDEPTNHLDMESCDALIGAIDSFDGAIMMVTHNEMFLHSLANRFIVFQESGITVFEGSYQRFLEKIGWEEEAGPLQERNDEQSPASAVNKKELRKKRADIMTRRSRELKPLEESISRIETAIISCEDEMKTINDEIIAASENGRGDRISGLSKEVHRIQSEIDRLYGELETQTIEYDARNRQFEEELQKVQFAE
ncbi:MAG TPA: ABC-F family ATP-binding cassette domain-containing protein [Spirochaetota bacterium]|nr:ABC-F family ATP-binding cassette domain-containing protein [Spirochaetota bacterium]HPI90955.1 ABC-F family ATP-binding cassette domain-containing protein [Spirochaetota bacterium]HPR49992.1 ABC-F family ATP-binding cassette domain-containing protein [Spirochaetota bacterium]